MYMTTSRVTLYRAGRGGALSTHRKPTLSGRIRQLIYNLGLYRNERSDAETRGRDMTFSDVHFRRRSRGDRLNVVAPHKSILF